MKKLNRLHTGNAQIYGAEMLKTPQRKFLFLFNMSGIFATAPLVRK